MHLYDLYIALQSEHIERYHLALENAEQLIMKNLPNLDSMISDILEILFRIENKYSKSDFDQLKFGAIKACLFVKPLLAAPILFERLGFREASIGHKIQLLGLLQDCIRQLANSQEKEKEFYEQAVTEGDHAQEFKTFFEPPKEHSQLDEAKEIVEKRISEKTQIKSSFVRKQKEEKSKKNYFLEIADKFIYPLLSLGVYSDSYMIYLFEKDLTIVYLKTISLSLFHSINR